jgi:PhzF family phenazine biosynthesis protein
MSAPESIPFFQIDAFTAAPYGGNPAAICILCEPLPADSMQAIAAEMNLSETAFVTPSGPDGARHLRWFTPTVEVPLCGHATLATAHALLVEKGEPAPARFRTLSGILTVHLEKGGWLRMDLPADPPETAPPPPGLLEALGCPAGSPCAVSRNLWIVEVPDAGSVEELTPDFGALGHVDMGPSALGVSVTAPGPHGTDFVSRFFGPWVGVDEDPVTGVAHTVLGPYWGTKLGKTRLTARQISRRGGDLRLEIAGDRVHLSGQAVTVARGELVNPESSS